MHAGVKRRHTSGGGRTGYHPRSHYVTRPALALDKLEAGTEIPLLRWLVALERITPDDLADALEQEVPAEPLSLLERRVLRATRTLPREVVDWFLDALDRLPGRPAGSWTLWIACPGALTLQSYSHVLPQMQQAADIFAAAVTQGVS